MRFKNKKIILVSISTALMIFIAGNLLVKKSDYSILTTSVLAMLQNVAEEYAPSPPDLEIESVSLVKTGEPTNSLNYHKYESTVIIHNSGGTLANARVTLNGGENQKTVLVRNTDEGFSLAAGESYIVRDYELLFDGDYNGGSAEMNINVIDKVDIDLSNNFYTAEFYEYSPKITGITLEEVLEDGTLVLGFDNSKFLDKRHAYEVYSVNAINIDGDRRFVETSFDEEVYQYFRIKNSLDTLNEDFDFVATTELDSHFVELGYDPFVESDATYVYIKAINPQSGYYAISNVLAFSKRDSFTRGEFAKIFVDYAGTTINDSGFSYFIDIPEDDENYSYIQTLYNKGVLNTTRNSYRPSAIMTRGEVLETVINYYDVDLKIGKGAPHFEDVDEDNQYFTYAETLYVTGGASAFSEYITLSKPASTSYLRHLINEYS